MVWLAPAAGMAQENNSGAARARLSLPLRSQYRDISQAVKLLNPHDELEYYREKMAEMAEHMGAMYNAVEKCQDVCRLNHQLEEDLVKRTGEMAVLQKAVSDLSESIREERAHTLHLHTKLDKLKMERESNCEPQPLFKENQPSTAEACTKSDDMGAQSKMSHKRRVTFAPAAPKCTQCTLLTEQISKLKTEYNEYTSYFFQDKELSQRESDKIIHELQDEVYYLSMRLKESNEEMCKNTVAVIKLKEDLIIKELHWRSELNDLKRSLAKIRSQSGLVDSDEMTVPGGGTQEACSQRENISVLCTEVLSLQEELQQRDYVLQDYKEKVRYLDSLLTQLESELKEVKKSSKRKLTTAFKYIDFLKKGFEDVDRRRILEMRGFHNALKLLRQSLCNMERHHRQLTRNVLNLGKEPLTSPNQNTSAFESAAESVNKFEDYLNNFRKKMEEVQAWLSGEGLRTEQRNAVCHSA